jgi:hypothetical protein
MKDGLQDLFDSTPQILEVPILLLTAPTSHKVKTELLISACSKVANFRT